MRPENPCIMDRQANAYGIILKVPKGKLYDLINSVYWATDMHQFRLDHMSPITHNPDFYLVAYRCEKKKSEKKFKSILKAFWEDEGKPPHKYHKNFTFHPLIETYQRTFLSSR